MAVRTFISRQVEHLQYAWMGRPDHAIYFGAGLGDDLLCGTVAYELKKRGAGRIVMFSRYPEIFARNPHVDGVYNFGGAIAGRMNHWGHSCIIPQYARYDPVNDIDITPNEHFLETMCRKARLGGTIDLRTYFYLTADEKAKGALHENQAVIHSTGLPIMPNKRWPSDRYQAVADALRNEVQWVQIGLPEDPPIAGATDLRGKTSFRESAAILSNSRLFLGQAGFLMHLARAVETRSVIVYGGREDPAVSGYIANENIVGRTPCSFCWQRARCDYGHECMQMISVERVVAAARSVLERHGTALETQKVDLDAKRETPAKLGN